MARPELETALRTSLTSRTLTLLSAPAGYGKTSLLASITTNPPLPHAWLTAHEDDDDPLRFLYSLVTTLRFFDPACGATAAALLAGSATPDPAHILDRLVDDLDSFASQPVVLVLDELEVLGNPAVYGLLDRLLQTTPAHVHVAIGTRRDPPIPLARLRARDQLSEFRAADLRLTDLEAQALLEAAGHRLESDDLVALYDRTEGWPAGYRFLTAALERIPNSADRSRYVDALARSDRFAAEFLVDDVLIRQDAPLQVFLLGTSILQELTPAACRAVTGRTDAAEVLADLATRNLFITQLEDGVYRYHALFRQLLESELARSTPERVPHLHALAAAYYGKVEPDRTMSHLIRAGLDAEAATLVEDSGGALLRQGFTASLERLLDLLPASVFDSRPRLSYLRAACRFEQGDVSGALPLVLIAIDGLQAAGDPHGLGQAAALLATIAVVQDDLERSGPLIDQALALPVTPADRVTLLLGRARLALLDRRWVSAQNDLEDALRVAQQHEEPDPLYALMYLHPTFPFLPNGLDLTERACALVRSRLGDPLPAGPLRIMYDSQIAISHLMRGRLDEALLACDDGLQLIQQLGVDAGGSALLLATTAISVNMARDNDQVVDSLLQMFELRAGRAGMPDAQIPGAFFLHGRLCWMEGRLEEAHQFLDRMAPAVDAGRLPGVPVLRAILSGMMLMSRHDFEEAERSFVNALRMESDRRASLAFGAARPPLAHLYFTWGRRQAALDTLGPMLAECEERGTPGMLLREGRLIVPVLRLAVESGIHAGTARRLLLALGDLEALPVEVPGTGQTLTRREIEVLILVSAGKGNRAIAEELSISLHTAKRHVANILAKLEASSRTAAVARSRELGIT